MSDPQAFDLGTYRSMRDQGRPCAALLYALDVGRTGTPDACCEAAAAILETLLAEGDAERALTLCEEALSVSAGRDAKARLRKLKGWALLGLDRAEEGRRLLAQGLRRQAEADEKAAFGRHLLEAALPTRDDDAFDGRPLLAIIEKTPGQALTADGLALLDRAVHWLEEALEDSPRHAGALRDLGRARMARALHERTAGQEGTARDLFEQAQASLGQAARWHSSLPEGALALQSLVIAMAAFDEWEEVEAETDRLVAIRPASADAWFARAFVLYHNWDGSSENGAEELAAALRRCLDLQSDHPGGTRLLAVLTDSDRAEDGAA